MPWTEEEKMKFAYVVLTEANRGLCKIEIALWCFFGFQVISGVGCLLHCCGVVDFFELLP